MSASLIQLVPQWGEGDAARLPTVPEMIREFQKREEELICLAIWAEQFGFNWRGIRFGCGILACRAAIEPADRFGLFPGWNFTLTRLPRPKGRRKLCAEIIGKSCAHDAGFRVMGGLALYSKHLQQDDITKKSFKTPHPCYECTDDYESSEYPSMPITTVRPKFACDWIDPNCDDSDLVIQRRKLREIAHEHRT